MDLQQVLLEHRKWISGEGGSYADLSGAYLRNADLQNANLQNANLRDANLWLATLWRANLRHADLRRADLWRADLWRADLRGADLSGTNLSDTNLTGANLTGAKGLSKTTAASLLVPPESGAFVGFKKCREGVISVEIPAESRRSSATTRKCRAEHVRTLSLPPGCQVATSRHDPEVTFRIGEYTYCDEWNPDRWVECGGGIHFFLTRQEALDY